MTQITNLTKIGNSFGVIINKKLLKEAGFTESNKLSIEVKKNGTIVIAAVKKHIPVNRDITTWDAQFKKAIREGKKPEKSIWPNNVSEKGDKDWTW
jgi:antitoxin component of MazEF toxin-antitoxin module